MHDDGKNGDAVAGDGVYTFLVPFNELVSGQVQLQVSAAFQGQLKRIVSPLLSISVWAEALVPARVSVAYPPQWVLHNSAALTKIDSATSPGPFTEDIVNTFGSFEIVRLPGANSGQLPIEQWFTANEQDAFSSDPLSQGSTMVAGHPAVVVTTAEIGQWTHYFVFAGGDVVHVAFGPDSDAFRVVYSQILSTMVIQ
jgi:hypothetical protein